MKKKTLIAFSLILLLIGNSLPAKAVEQVNKVTYSKKYYLQESHKKISSDLLKLIDEQYRTNKETKEQVKSSIKNMKALIKAEDSSSCGLNKSNDDLVYVYIRVNDNESTHIIDNYTNKVKNRDEKNHIATAWVEVNKVNVIATLEGVRSINTVLPPEVKAGSVTSEGDALQNIDSFRNLSGIDGTGVKIGIISDGVDNLASAQATGDLPGDVITLSNTVGGDEGTAMLEIVNDLAPGAQLYFHDCGDNELAFNDAVDALVNAGCQVICDDIGWITQPFFEDGIIASHISSVIDSNNIVYVSSAGNEAQNHYQGTFRADNTGQYFHDFDPSSAGYSPLLVYIPYGETVRVVLEWNDRWGASSNDYDLILADLDGTSLVTSIEDQNGDGYPVELVYWTNTNASGYYQIVVPKYAGVAKTLELYVYGGYIADGYYTSSDSIFGHAAVPKVIAVGAANADSPNIIAYYSSQGPVTISYPSAVKRNKPDIIGIDGVSVTGAGSFSNPFYGTSAAAPDVAAIAGLLWAQNPSKSASEIRTMITKGGIDLGTAGYDTVYGYGMLNMILVASPCIPENLAAAPSDKSAIISWTANAESDIAGYQLEYKAEGAAYWTIKTFTSTVTSTTIGSLSNGGNYQFRLKAKDSAGNFSGYTDIVTCMPVDNVAPGVPTSFRMTSVNDSRIVLAWTAPTATDLSGYRIAYQKAGDTEWTETGTIAKIVTYTLTGLENDINYKLKIQSRDSTGNWSAYSAEIEAMPQDKTPPAVPTGLTTLVGTDKTIQISWTANTETDLDGYEVAWQKYGTTIWQSEVVGKETLSKTVESLIHNTRYNFKVRAKDLKGNWSNYSTVVYAIAKDQVAPTSPVGLAAAPSDKSAIISWTANAESDIAGYQLEYKTTAATNWTVKTLAGTVTSTTVGSLSNGGTYQFRLKAKDSAGNFSGYTDIVTCIPVDNVAPGVPTSFRMTSVNDSRIVLAWTAPTATDLSGYRIAYQKAGDTEWTETGTIAKIVTYTLTGLENDINYKLKIQSRDSTGNWSAYSAEIEAMPQDKTPPAVPTGLTTLVGTDKTIQISWTANTETDLDGYEIAWQKYGTTIWQSEVVGKETLSKTVENLTHNARYYFKVRAKDLKGNWSNYSTVVYAIAKDQVAPTSPVGLAAAPSDKSAIISWTANAESDIAGYQLEYKTTAATNWTVKTLAGTVTSTTVGSLSNGGTYQFRLKAKDSAGNFSGYTDIVTCIPVDNVAPGVPTNFKMTSVNDGRIVLAWTAPTATDLSGYRITYQKAGDTEWTETGTIAKIVTYTLTGLENDINYKLKIQSRDSTGNWSAYSSEIEAMPQDKTPPAVPTGLTTLVGTDKTIQISWTANTETDLDGYEIAWQKYGTTIWQSEVVGKETLSKTVENLTHNARYYFKVRAKDLKGNWSNYSTVVYAIAKDQVAPTSPVGLAAAPSDKSAIISWTANGESDIAGYQLEYKAEGAAYWTIKTFTSTVTSTTIGSLSNGGNYQFRLKAKDSAGNFSGYTDTVTCVPDL